MAELLAELGASVTLVARSSADLEAVQRGLATPRGQTHHRVSADFAEPEQVRDVAQRLAQDRGTLHVLVNNTGGPPGGPILDADAAAFERALRMHLLCNHHLVQALVPGMRAAGYGRVINIISTSVREPIPGLGVSNTTRWAVAAWAKTLARELASSGITVNNVLPGFTETERLTSLFATRAQREARSADDVRREALASVPAGRFAEPREIAAAVAFLASPAASYVNGVNLPVDGGRLHSM